jgi:CheY-like chemotaxis protein
VLEAESGEEASRTAERASETIDLLLTDANMPGMSGIEVANTLVGLIPDLRVVIMSGYTAEALMVQGIPGPVSLLPKPFTPKELSRKVADILAGR